jgi:hypothetical protein
MSSLMKVQIIVAAGQQNKCEKMIRQKKYSLNASGHYGDGKSYMLQFTARVNEIITFLNDVGFKRIKAQCVAYEISE